MNTGRLTGINKRLSVFVMTLGHGIHTLECLSHTNKMFLIHLINEMEDRGIMQEGALFNKLSHGKSTPMTLASFFFFVV